MDDRGCRRKKRVRRRDHLVSGPDIQCFQCQRDRIGAVGDTDRVTGAAKRRKVGLERLNFSPADKVPSGEDRVDTVTDVPIRSRVLGNQVEVRDLEKRCRQ